MIRLMLETIKIVGTEILNLKFIYKVKILKFTKMKHLFLVLAATLSLSAVAQNRDVENLNKRLQKSDESIADAKKASKFATWADRSKLFVEFANVYSKKLIAGSSFDIVMPEYGQPESVEEVMISGVPLVKYDYPNVEIYLDGSNNVQYWKIKKDAVENPLDKAYEALAKGKEVNSIDFMTKGSIPAGMLMNQFNIEGNNAYSLDDKIRAAKMFEGSLKVSELLGEVDTLTTYNIGMAYFYGEDYASSIPYFEKVLALGDEKDGDVYYYISAANDKLGNADKAISVIEKGFEKYPNSATVMSGIINTYMNNDKNPELLIDIIRGAQKIDPSNVSLYITEGAIWDKLNRTDMAEEAFKKALEYQPNNATIYFNIGLVRTKHRDALIQQAEQLDLNDYKGYDALINQSVEVSKGALEMLEKSYELNPNDINTVTLLRELYYTLRDKGDQYEAAYNKYNDLQKSMQ